MVLFTIESVSKLSKWSSEGDAHQAKIIWVLSSLNTIPKATMGRTALAPLVVLQ